MSEKQRPMADTSRATMRQVDNCWSCRLISGAGLTAAGLYVAHHGRRQTSLGASLALNSVAAGLCLLGACRVFNLPPFRPIKVETQ